jgi:cyclopropane fatty-acyl-phospholipid synthase-like methyltransferase
MKERRAIESYDGLAKWYNTHYQEMNGTWVTPPEDCNRHLDDLDVPFDKTLRLLDIGCGGGHFLEQATKRVKCVGVEISRVALLYAHERLYGRGVILIEASLEGIEPWLQFDYIVSMGSLEHVLELDKALDKIRILLKPTGAFYFYLPNTSWVHKDQPNELLADEPWWRAKLKEHGLQVDTTKAWGVDNIAYKGSAC